MNCRLVDSFYNYIENECINTVKLPSGGMCSVFSDGTDPLIQKPPYYLEVFVNEMNDYIKEIQSPSGKQNKLHNIIGKRFNDVLVSLIDNKSRLRDLCITDCENFDVNPAIAKYINPYMLVLMRNLNTMCVGIYDYIEEFHKGKNTNMFG